MTGATRALCLVYLLKHIYQIVRTFRGAEGVIVMKMIPPIEIYNRKQQKTFYFINITFSFFRHFFLGYLQGMENYLSKYAPRLEKNLLQKANLMSFFGQFPDRKVIDIQGK